MPTIILKKNLIKIRKTSKNKKALPLELLVEILNESNALFFNNLNKCGSQRLICYEKAKNLLTSSTLVYFYAGEIFKNTKLKNIYKMSKIEDADEIIKNKPLELSDDAKIAIGFYMEAKRDYEDSIEALEGSKLAYEGSKLAFEHSRSVYDKAQQRKNTSKTRLEKAANFLTEKFPTSETSKRKMGVEKVEESFIQTKKKKICKCLRSFAEAYTKLAEERPGLFCFDDGLYEQSTSQGGSKNYLECCCCEKEEEKKPENK